MHINHIIQTLPQFKSANLQHISYKQLTLGQSNQSYIITYQNKRYLLRIPPKKSTVFIDRTHEFHNLQQAAAWGLTPKPLYFDTHTGIMLRDYLPGQTILDENNHLLVETLTHVAKLMSRLHHQAAKFSNTINYFKVINHALSKLKRTELPKPYNRLLPALLAIEKKLNKLNPTCAPCHGDLVPHNLIAYNNTVLLIDWEYSGNSDPAWDLAYLFHYSDLTNQATDVFWQHYNLTDNSLKTRIQLYAPIVEYINALTLRQWIVNEWFPLPQEKLLQLETNSLTNTEQLLCTD